MSETTIQIPPELFAPAESSSFTGSYDPGVVSAGPDLYSFAQPLSYDIMVTNTGGALLVSGTVEGRATTSCARCLKPFDLDISGEVEGYFLLHDDDEPLEDMEEDEFDVIGADNTIDLAPLFDAAILMDVPLVPLHDEDCKGLCPHCGIDRNVESCDCEEAADAADAADAAAANPFAVLADLKFDGEADD